MKSNIIRFATYSDFPLIYKYDEFLGDRRLDMQAGNLYVADIHKNDKAVGYLAVSNTDCFGWPLISSICVRKDVRRNQIASDLLKFVRAQENFLRLYITTEKTNFPMLSVLKNNGIDEVGYIDKLNFSEERELIFRVK